MPLTLKKKIFELVDATYDDQDATRFLNVGMLILISLNVVAAILETEGAKMELIVTPSISKGHVQAMVE